MLFSEAQKLDNYFGIRKIFQFRKMAVFNYVSLQYYTYVSVLAFMLLLYTKLKGIIKNFLYICPYTCHLYRFNFDCSLSVSPDLLNFLEVIFASFSKNLHERPLH